uniref:NADH-ubiquinone oxidoreductase chain 4 n=1 Tax=Crenidorsum turpiniae TaxID=2774091 RepID=A0A7L7S616_9HEMI|nr:NADH dehydrogenase subunit 4 [Crenidorsum turpiniae]QNV48537.1 NADH dehydrogenase subunit 4 [Crenidorsum turpiniae]
MLKFLIPMIMMMVMKNKNFKIAISTLIILFNLSLQSTDMSKMSYIFMGDFLSFWMTNLTIWIMMIISMIKINNMKMMVKINSTLIMVLMMTFFNWSFMLFFILFEVSMVMIVVIVMSWGYQPERIEATMFMIILTSMFTLPFFSSLMHNFKKLNFWTLNELSTWDFLSFMFIFMVKMPVYFIHIWLPKVHVESPVQGSMILASIMLKLGCFGMIRMTKMATKMMTKYEFMILSFALWTTLILSLACNIQSDLKSVVAYSSVVHMSITLVSITLAKSKGILASVIIMVGHGACSSAMFFMCNQAYKISKSRSMMMNKGILVSMPTASTAWFFLCMSNAPMPPSINIVGELLAFKAAISWSSTMMVLVFLIMLFSSCFSITVFCVMAHGKFSMNMNLPASSTAKSMMITIIHIIPAIALITKSSMMMI